MKVAVAISLNYGTGWYDSNRDYPQLLFHPKIISMIQEGRRLELTERWLVENNIVENTENLYLCDLGNDGLVVEWVWENTIFDIDCYDGCESIRYYGTLTGLQIA